MPTRTAPGPGPFALPRPARERLEDRAARAAELAGKEGERSVAAVTVALPADLDLSAAVLAARGPGDRFFCLEQPERGGFALSALGAAALIEARGPRRFAQAAERARELGRWTFADDPAEDPARPPAAGPVFVGGFAFAEDGGTAPEWSSLAPASLVLPELALVRHGGESRMTVCVAAEGDEAPEALAARALERVDQLR